MSAGHLLGTLASLLACSSCSVTRTDEPPSTPTSRDFQATIARVERSDPGSPATLIAQLTYADFLLNGVSGPACAQQLTQVQEQLGSVNANSKASAMFPDGWARAVDIEYRLHLARADCGVSDVNNELRTAVAAAHRAVDLYRSTFDYHSMVIMQFDVAVVLRRLGENAAALSALETTLAMDREYGFDDDARENYALLLTWRGEPADESHVSEFMRDFPKRKVTLTFGWHSSDVPMRLESHRENWQDGQILRSRAAAEFERRIVADADGGWDVSYADRLTRYEPGVWPATQEPRKDLPMTFSAVPLPLGFKVSAAGEFGGVTDSAAFAESLLAKATELIRSTMPSGEGARELADEAVDTAANYFSPGALEAGTAETYQLETAMWIGATLEQGVWREISAPLSLPGMSRVVVQNRVQFAFTRMVPCTSGEAVQRCAEIVMHVMPDQGDLDQIVADFVLAGTDVRLRNYKASIEARIVVDPQTLFPYSREERIYWYASVGKGTRGSLIRSEHFVSTTL